MADNPARSQDSPEPEPLTLTAFAASLYHAERTDNSFKFVNVPPFSKRGLLRSRLRWPRPDQKGVYVPNL